MLSPVFRIEVVAFLHERREAAYAEAAREELSLILVRVAPGFCKCESMVFRSLMDVLDMMAQIDSSCVTLTLRVLSGAFRDTMCCEMSLIGVWIATKVALLASIGEFVRSIRHAGVYSLMLSHMSLVSVTFPDCLGMFANVTPVEMFTGLR